LAAFTKDQIDLSVYDDAIDELTGKVNSTSLTLKNGELTIDADKTTIKDSNLTLSQFTKD
jgi:phage baseplate assembly protein gpV